jgi:hypothetical protein
MYMAREEPVLGTGFLGEHDSPLNPELTFFALCAWFHLAEMLILKEIGNEAVLM